MAQDFLLPRLAAVLLNNLRVLGSAERLGPFDVSSHGMGQTV